MSDVTMRVLVCLICNRTMEGADQPKFTWQLGEPATVPGDAITGDPMCGASGGHATDDLGNYGDGTYCTLAPHPATAAHRFEVP